MFQKINNKFDIGSYEILDQQITYGQTVDGVFKGIKYYNVNYANQEQIRAVIPVQYQKDFYISLFKINSLIPPHTDTYDRVTINFYIQPSNYVTQFYKLNTDKAQRTQVENQVDGYIFDEKDLIKVDSFVAQDCEIYALDVTQIHSVIPSQGVDDRIVVNLSTHNYNFEEVCDMLSDTGNL